MTEQLYQLLDSGHGKKLERFGAYILSRPCSIALWNPSAPKQLWNQAHAVFERIQKKGWSELESLPTHWLIHLEQLTFKISTTDFGHLGVFPEHASFWPRLKNKIQKEKRAVSVLNLFAYSGGATLAAASAGAKVTHVDASKGMVAWAKENASLNHLSENSIRWIVDDVLKFMKRELRRGQAYDVIILDPPTFGRGSKGEVFKIERDIQHLLETCRQLLSKQPLMILFSSHSSGFTPLVMQHLLSQHTKSLKGTIESGEMKIIGENTLPLPSGSYALWERS